ncbi:MAG: DUF2062 domain-containing protein [Proteobacteria bacterium]|nr:DUF2062 domain-containing protein [Pseudomonadota bacterium]
MPRRLLKRITARFEPMLDAVVHNRWLRRYVPALTDPDLWHLNRHSTARGVAIGLACGLIPGPLQVAGTAVGCVALRGNLPLAVITTLYTNPVTIVPLYLVAYELGHLFIGGARSAHLGVPPVMSFDLAGLQAFWTWIKALGPSLALGLPLLAATLALVGYVVVLVAWRCHTVRAWRARAVRRAT